MYNGARKIGKILFSPIFLSTFPKSGNKGNFSFFFKLRFHYNRCFVFGFVHSEFRNKIFKKEIITIV